jgi:hypothetical protein
MQRGGPVVITRFVFFASAWVTYTLIRDADSFFEQVGAVIIATLCSYVAGDFLDPVADED